MIAIRQPQEIAKLQASGRILRELWDALKPAVVGGTATAELDELAARFIAERGGTPTFKGYRGYPAALCISINDEVVHGIPRPDRQLKDGDLVGIDVGVTLDGYIADAARSLVVGGSPGPEALKLVATARQALDRAIEQSRPGNRIKDLSRAIQETAEAAGYTVVRQLCGHGVGTSLHEAPEIPNFVKAGPSATLRPGMVLAIEPMVNAGAWQVRFLPDGWTVVTEDGSLSAHFEDTVVVTEDQPLVTTR